MDITQTVTEALSGTRKVKITFLPKGNPMPLLVMANPQKFKVNISAVDIEILGKVVKTGKWPPVHDRTVLVPFTDRFDAEQFIKAIDGQIEDIEIA